MITEKIQIKKGDVYIIDVSAFLHKTTVQDVCTKNQLVKHSYYSWETVAQFMSRRPMKIGRVRKFLGIPFGVIREK